MCSMEWSSRTVPVQPIPGSHADASVLATVTTAKYADGMPLYRMQNVLARRQIYVVL